MSSILFEKNKILKNNKKENIELEAPKWHILSAGRTKIIERESEWMSIADDRLIVFKTSILAKYREQKQQRKTNTESTI